MDTTDNEIKTTDELIRAALLEKDEDRYWNIVMVLQKRGTRETFEIAHTLCLSENADERTLGVYILRQLGEPDRAFPYEAVDVFLKILAKERDPKVLAATASALSHYDVARKVEPLIRLSNHPDADVRFAVVEGLLWRQEEQAVATMIELMRDKDQDVRNWATFGIGQMEDVDSPKIREALLQRVNDEYDEVRGEALRGLAVRGDERVIEPLIRELLLIVEADDWCNNAVEAAVAIADIRLYPALMAIKESGVEDSTLEHAIALCRIPLPTEADDEPDEADTTCPVCGLRNAFTSSDEYQFCPRCGWQKDMEQRADPDLKDPWYGRSLNQECERWQKRLETARQ